MKKKNETDTLKETITLLQSKEAEELKSLKEQFHLTYESFKPLNLIKSTFREITSSPEIKNTILSNSIGLTSGYLTKKVLFGTTHNPLKKIVGTILEFALANIISKHTDGIKSTGEILLYHFLKRSKKPHKTFHHNGNARLV